MNLLNRFETFLSFSTPIERLEIIEKLLEPYCRYCGEEKPDCKCEKLQKGT